MKASQEKCSNTDFIYHKFHLNLLGFEPWSLVWKVSAVAIWINMCLKKICMSTRTWKQSTKYNHQSLKLIYILIHKIYTKFWHKTHTLVYRTKKITTNQHIINNNTCAATWTITMDNYCSHKHKEATHENCAIFR